MEPEEFPSAGKKRLSILLGSNFKVGQTGEFAWLALKRMGHHVIPFTPSENPPQSWMKTAPDVDAALLHKSFNSIPDMLLMVESSTGRPFLPERIADLEIPTGYWAYDNYLNFRWHKEVAALFDHCFFAQYNRMALARRYGADNVHWLPFAADETFHRDFGVERDIDIGYVGTITPQKQRYFAALEKSGLRVTTNDRYLEHEQVGRFYSRCKLVYNILARRDMNVRTFEASAAGALVVNQSWIDEGCRMIFTGGENMMFHHFDDAPGICRRLLENEPERARMAGAAKRLVMSGHTYRHRMQRALEILSGGVSEARMKRNAGFQVPVAEALVCAHRDFRWRARAAAAMKKALRASAAGTAAHLFKYARYRVREKIEKIAWSFGKAPV